MQSVGSYFRTEKIFPFFGEQRIEIDELYFLFFGQRLQFLVDIWNEASFAGEPFVALETFVDGQQALQINLGLR